MKSMKFLVVLLSCLTLALLAGAALAQSKPTVGQNAGNVKFAATLTPEEAAYLGVPAGAPFTLKDIKAPYVLAETFSTTCPHCMHQAPLLNQLFTMVENDAKLKDKLKILSVGQGNDEMNVKMWKAVQKVPFPVLPDKESTLSKAYDQPGVPITAVLDKSGKVVWVHIGAFESAEEALKGIKKVVK